MREILSLQCGQRANFLATHFWNIQESYFTYSDSEQPSVEHDVHFRAGIGADGSETFTPRTVIYDLKGGFGSLRKYNALYEPSLDETDRHGVWEGNIFTQMQPIIESNEYQRNLSQGLPTSPLTADQVRYWSDFNRVFYHPRSIVQLTEYELDSQLMPFENWATGQELFRDLDKGADLFDRDVRPFAEECDQLAGIQIFASVDDAWGGFSSNYTDVLRDEFGKASIWLWALEDGRRMARPAELRRTANLAKSLQAMAPHVSAYIRLSHLPASVPTCVNLSSASDWSNSGLLSSVMETVILPTRLRPGHGRSASLAELEAVLNSTGSRTINDLQACMVTKKDFAGEDQPLGTVSVEGGSQLTRTKAHMSKQYHLDYSPTPHQPSLGHQPHIFGQIKVQRCISERQVEDMDLDGSSDHEAVAEIYPTNIPFPQLDSFPSTLFGTSYANIGIQASLSTTSETKTRLKDLARSISRAIEVDIREALLNDLAELGEAYADGWQSSSDSGVDN